MQKYPLEDIIIKNNIILDNNNFISEIKNNDQYEIIEEPVILMQTLHSCYSHAIIDSCFPVFWTIQDLITEKIIDRSDVRIIICDKMVKEFPIQNLPLINGELLDYNGVYSDIIHILTKNPIIFQHSNKKKYMIKTLIIYPENDKWQRSPWNCSEYYSNSRNISLNSVRFNDSKIYSMLDKFRSFVLNKYSLTEIKTNNLIIIERKTNRKINPKLMKSLIDEVSKNTTWNFQGVKILEDMTFMEQVSLFLSSRIIIFRHGSALINLLWSQSNSLIFELGGGTDGIYAPQMFNRIAKLTNSYHSCINYNTCDVNRDIIKHIKNI